MPIPPLHVSLRSFIVALALAAPTALAGTDVVRYDDPAGWFSLMHPEAWEVYGEAGDVELYGGTFATLVQVTVFSRDELPVDDADELSELLVEGWTHAWEDVEVGAPEHVTLAGLDARRSGFEGVDPLPIEVPRRGAAYLAFTDASLVVVVYTVPTAVAEEVMPEIEAVLESLTLAP